MSIEGTRGAAAAGNASLTARDMAMPDTLPPGRAAGNGEDANGAAAAANGRPVARAARGALACARARAACASVDARLGRVDRAARPRRGERARAAPARGPAAAAG